MSETPRTDAEFKLEAFFDGTGIVETVLVEFAQELESELVDKEKQLAEAQAEIENLKWHINSEKAKAEAALELNGKAIELVDEARADADHWKSECNTLQRMVHEARAEIERKDAMIERLRSTLACARPYVADSDSLSTKRMLDTVDAALAAAEGGE